MLEGVLGSLTAEQVLVFLTARGGKAYAKEIADLFGTRVSQVQRVLERLEREGVLVSNKIGRTRVYEWNPRFAFRLELEALMRRAIDLYPARAREALVMNRRRPRRAGKPL